MAVVKPPQPLSGIARFPGEVGASLDAFERWLNQMFDRHRPAGVAFEAPILTANKTSVAVARKLMSMVGIVLMVCHRRGIRWVREVQPSSVKLFVSGNGGPGKENVKRAIQSFGWTFEASDEADALSVWLMAASLYATERRAAA